MRVCLLFLLCVITHPVFCQKEATHWFFGSKAGLAFTQSGPTPLQGSAMNTQDGCTVLSDSETGEVLFYSNGRNVWNRNHQLMPNGQDFPSDCWSALTQAALIVPFPGDRTKYYLFSIYYTTQLGGSIFIENNCAYGRYSTALFREVKYSIIDMSLDGGMGDVVIDSKHTSLHTNATEKLTAVPHTNGSDYWILTHAFGSNEFYAHLLTSSGIAAPIITSIGAAHELKPTEFFSDEETIGYMKASPDGTKLACAVASAKRPFDLFDFNAATGQLTNYINLGSISGQYGVSFSPDNSKLYATTDDRPDPNAYPYPDIIIQYDLHAGNAADIIASRQSIFRDNPLTNIPGHGIFEGFQLLETGLQLAPDGKLYATSDYAYDPADGHIMVVIEKPNEAGINCQVNYKQFDFGNGRVGSGLPNFIESYFNGVESSSTCAEASSLTFYPNPTPGNVEVHFLTGCDPSLKITVFTSLGQLVTTIETDTTETHIDLSTLASGVYFFIVSTPYTAKQVRRIVKL